MVLLWLGPSGPAPLYRRSGEHVYGVCTACVQRVYSVCTACAVAVQELYGIRWEITMSHMESIRFSPSSCSGPVPRIRGTGPGDEAHSMIDPYN